MHCKLLINAFEKVRTELKKDGVTPSDHRCAKELSAIISKDFIYGEKRLGFYYKEAKNNPEKEVEIPQPQVLLALAKYLGYENYEDFVLKNEKRKEREMKAIDEDALLLANNETKAQNRNRLENSTKGKWNTRNILAIVAVLIVVVTSIYLYTSRQKWMVWKEDHYELSSFDADLFKNGILKLYNEEHYQYLKKIRPSCKTKFFNNDGTERIWYGKNARNDYEYFTALAKHPETGKTLKPITEYIIKKHICQ
ncbi:hypothetical protein [Aequorivita echinoideorum]|uniref:Uncharacterized protein n=1 Tax=Aequorivita echinoideorum TaxID=1549647 RepID=A0ABS5S679_9FLAO|nr:hypothetical protein [Aequorivita echinoideorum]MBT0607887.1 hypothetical protein [Aequorivita echinoideorum]